MEEQIKWLDKAKQYAIKNKIVIVLSVALVLAIGSKINVEVTNFKTITKEVEKMVEKPVAINTVSKYGNSFICVDTSKMYTIKKEVVKPKGVEKTKHARGLELENGYSLYITEFTPLDSKNK